MTYASTLAQAKAFLKQDYPRFKAELRAYVIHRVIDDLDPDRATDVSVVQLAAFKASGPDGTTALRYRYGLLGLWHVEMVERPEGHVHGLCAACTKAWRRAHKLKGDDDIEHVPFYRPKADTDAMWARTEAALEKLPTTKMVGA